MNDRYETVANDVRLKLPVGACRFIASVARTDTEEAAKAFIEQVSSEFVDATHNAYAYKIGLGDTAVCRQSDAAEPAGTAGPPMLAAIENLGLTNVTVVGTRYFGGVKLGIGGLIRAYRACADAGLSAAGRKIEISKKSLVVAVSYDLLGTVMREIAAAGGSVDSVIYRDSGVEVKCIVPLSVSETVQTQLTNATKGKAEIKVGNTKR